MGTKSFIEAVAKIHNEDKRFAPEAYFFIREALDFTLQLFSKPASGPERHVSAGELLNGIQKFALKEFGPVAFRVLNTWGIYKCRDFGAIVFNLVDQGILGKNENDSIADFNNGFDFNTAFRKPFEPRKGKKTVKEQVKKKETATGRNKEKSK